MDIESSSNILSESSISLNEQKNIKTKKTYKKRDPLYYYYIISGNTYKYTCENKQYKNNLRFKCSDTKCKSKGIYYENLGKFIPKEGEDYNHIDYETHSYIIPIIYKNKFQIIF